MEGGGEEGGGEEGGSKNNLLLTWSSANLRRAAMGSPPGERTKMRGAQLWESAKALGRLKGGGSMYFLPSLATTKSCTPGITCRVCVSV